MTLRKRDSRSSLLFDGLVETPTEVPWDELDRFDTQDAADVAVGFLGDAVALADLVDRAAPLDAATHCTVASDDGHYRVSIPIGELRNKGWMVFRFEGEPLPRDRGGPLRLIVPEGRTLCWNVKAVVGMRFTDGPEPDSVPANPPH